MPDQWHSILAAWLGTYLLHSTLLLGGAWLAATCLKRLSDEIKEVLWKTALVGGGYRDASGKPEPVASGRQYEHRPAGAGCSE